MAKPMKSITTRKKVLLAFCIALAVGLCAAAVAVTAKSQRGTDPAVDAAPVAASASSTSSSATEAKYTQAAWYTGLTSTQKSFADFIMKGKWCSVDGNDTVTFDAQGRSVVNGKASSDPVTLVDVTADSESSGTAVVTSTDDDHVIAVTVVNGTGNGSATSASSSTVKKLYQMRSSAFSSKALIRASDATTFKVTGNTSAGYKAFLTAASKTTQSAIESALREWCNQNVPLAQTAAWEGSYTVDTQGNTVTTEYACDNAKATVVTCRVSLTDGATTFAASGSAAQSATTATSSSTTSIAASSSSSSASSTTASSASKG